MRDLLVGALMLCATVATSARAASLLEPVAENINWAQPSPLFEGVKLGDNITDMYARLQCIEKSRGENDDGERVSCLLKGAADDVSLEYEALNAEASKDGAIVEVLVLRLFPTRLTPDAIRAVRAEYTKRFGPPTLAQWPDGTEDATGSTATRQLCWGRQCRCSPPGRCSYTNQATGEVAPKPLEFSTWDPKGDGAILTLRESPFVATNSAGAEAETEDASALRWVDAVSVLVRRLGEQP